MTEFMPGDRVVCVDSDDSYLKLAAVYTVEGMTKNGSFVRLKEVPDAWYTYRFKRVPEESPKFKVGDKVRTKYGSSTSAFWWRAYTVESIPFYTNPGEYPEITLVGVDGKYRANEFELMPEFTKGTLVECICEHYPRLNQGGLYVIREIFFEGEAPLVKLEDTQGNRVGHEWYLNRFKPVKLQEPPQSNEEVMRKVSLQPYEQTGKLSAVDHVNNPEHYKGLPAEPIEFIMKNDPEGKFAKGNAIKYVSRAGRKLYPDSTAQDSEITDLQKAIRCLEMRINQIRNPEGPF